MKITQDIVDKAFVVRYKVTEDFFYADDVERIRRVLNNAHGVTINISDAVDFWRWRSDLVCASWLSIYNDEEIIDQFGKFIKRADVIDEKVDNKETSLRKIRVVLDSPRMHRGEDNPNPEDYLDFEVDFSSEWQYNFFYDLVYDRIAMIDRWK